MLTDGRMDGQRDGNLHAEVAHAKAGATKRRNYEYVQTALSATIPYIKCFAYDASVVSGTPEVHPIISQW